ncbi:MAG: hypothetical protein EXX96DRAFT_536316 [Benjaminiella poitrasii]|nr:MAG: hypothetical protein EXX96DRAFT_536316 [Benjaminiella poitrasii]
MANKSSLTVITGTPSSISIRPDIIFSTKLSYGKEIEIGNGEIRQPNVSKSSVNATRARVLEKAKRQLYMKIKETGAPNTLVTFGVLIHGYSFEVYLVRFLNGIDEALIHALRSMLTLKVALLYKHSMLMSFAGGDDDDHIVNNHANLLPTVAHTTIYKEERIQ